MRHTKHYTQHKPAAESQRNPTPEEHEVLRKERLSTVLVMMPATWTPVSLLAVALRIRAARPATSGAAWLVPESVLKGKTGHVQGSVVSVLLGHVEMMLSPGAATCGVREGQVGGIRVVYS